MRFDAHERNATRKRLLGGRRFEAYCSPLEHLVYRGIARPRSAPDLRMHLVTQFGTMARALIA